MLIIKKYGMEYCISQVIFVVLFYCRDNDTFLSVSSLRNLWKQRQNSKIVNLKTQEYEKVSFS